MILTTEEAAEQAGVSVQTIRRWVASGDLKPLRMDAKPWRFRWEDVAEVQLSHRSQAWRQRHAKAVDGWRHDCSVGPI